MRTTFLAFSDLSRVTKPSVDAKRVGHVFRPQVELLEERAMLTTTLPAGFTETTVATGITSPTAMEFSPDGRLWVLEQTGNVKLVRSDGTLFTALHENVDSNGERGHAGHRVRPQLRRKSFRLSLLHQSRRRCCILGHGRAQPVESLHGRRQQSTATGLYQRGTHS